MSKNAKRQLRKVQEESRKGTKPMASKPAPHPVLSVEQRLQSIITGLLGGPRGDADMHHMLGAAKAILLLEQNGTPYTVKKDSDDTLIFLAGKNIYEIDFMELARQGASL